MAEVMPYAVTSLQSGDVATALAVVTTMARAYTRGRGFVGGEPNDDIAAVITTAATRLAGNGDQLARKKVDDIEYEFSLRGSFGWTLAEQVVLNRYRVRAM